MWLPILALAGFSALKSIELVWEINPTTAQTLEAWNPDPNIPLDTRFGSPLAALLATYLDMTVNEYPPICFFRE
jgi:hypothetical protein